MVACAFSIEGGVVAINQILEWHTCTKTLSFPLCSPRPHMQTLCTVIHKQTYINTSLACAQALHSCQPNLPLSNRPEGFWCSNYFCHAVMFKKPRAIHLQHCPSVCIHPVSCLCRWFSLSSIVIFLQWCSNIKLCYISLFRVPVTLQSTHVEK